MTFRIALTAPQAKAYRALQRLAFKGHTCDQSQDRIALLAGFSRRHTITLLHELRDLGYIDWTKARRPGCKWTHNVYTLTDWNPVNRRQVLRDVAHAKACRDARIRRLHTEGTAGPTRAPSPRSIPSRTTSNALPARSARARTARIVRIDSRRSAVDPHPTREPAKVVHICKGCEALSRQVEQMTEALQREREERDIAEQQRIRAGRAEQAARNELRAALEADPTSETIHEVIDYWKVACGHPRAKNRLDDERGKAVRKALKHYSQGELHEMIDGLALAPFTMFGRRKLTGTDDSRRDELEFVLRRDDEVRKLIEIARRAKDATADAAWLAWQRVSAQEWAAFLTLRDKVVGDRHHRRGVTG